MARRPLGELLIGHLKATAFGLMAAYFVQKGELAVALRKATAERDTAHARVRELEAALCCERSAAQRAEEARRVSAAAPAGEGTSALSLPDQATPEASALDRTAAELSTALRELEAKLHAAYALRDGFLRLAEKDPHPTGRSTWRTAANEVAHALGLGGAR